MTERELSFEPEISPPVQEPVSVAETVEKQYEVAPEFVEQIENSNLDSETKVSLLLVKAGLKPSSETSITVRNGENIFLTDEEVEEVRSMIQSSGLAAEVGEKSSETIEHQDPQTGEIQSRALERVGIIMGKSQEDLDRLKTVNAKSLTPEQVERGEYSQEEKENGYREHGLAYGFPPTAIEAFIKYMAGDKNACIENTELPEEVQKSDAVAFGRLFFGFSREHWQEEMKQGKTWADAIKLISPKVYEKVMEDAENLRRFGEKERQWQQFEKTFKETTDALGYGIEPKIMDTVIGLNALGFHTSQSCEGHIDRGRITPWVDANSKEQPKQFIGEDEVYQEVADEYGLSKEEVERALGDKCFEAWQKASERMSKNDYTPEFKQWIEDNEKMAQRAKELVAEFNSQRETIGNSRIEIAEHGFHTLEIHNGGEDYESVSKQRTEQEKQELAERLVQYQEEFRQFAEFLKGKFFESTNKNPEKTKGESDASPEEKERKLKRALFEIQLQYAQRLFEKKIPSPSDSINTETMDFKQTLEEFTDLSTIVRDAFLKRTGKDFGSEENYKEFEKINQAVTKKIVDTYNANPDTWMDNVEVFISDAINELPEGGPLQEKGPEESRAGVLRYSVGAGHGGLEEYGITPEDECVKTHLDPLFKQEDVPKGKKLSELYKEAYAMIAKEVKEHHPNAKALVSESWLFDTNLAKEIGMHTYPSGNENMFRSRTFWGQFINREGKINKERVKQFLETGKPPFRVRSGYIPIDEFMSKYEPK